MYIRGSSGAKLGDLRIVGTRRGMHMASRVPKTKLSGSKLEIYLASAFTFTRDILVDYSSLILANFQEISFIKIEKIEIFRVFLHFDSFGIRKQLRFFLQKPAFCFERGLLRNLGSYVSGD
jgi:hypothetical protein